VSKLLLSPEATRRARDRLPAWSHQNWLRDHIGKKVYVILCSRQSSTENPVILQQADNFTVMIEFISPENFKLTGRTKIIFKHAIESIEPAA
jgi:hypothetical protein